ncbi:hypothetical protein [Streptomyces sp. NPDC056105]|uniref:hypothetical protein n=1 Tax=Streptomyces sp. NPDC056105 TaxID=3345714 RepID=UPI0035E07BB7
MDQERRIAEPNQALHPGKGRIERYNDANGAVYETTHLDAHGNAFTQNHQLGPAERYGYNYVGADAPPMRRAPAPSWGPVAGAAAATGVAAAGAATYHAIGSDFVDENPADEDGALGIALLLLFLVLLALGPLFVGAWMFRRARHRGTTTTHGTFVILMEGAWLAMLWGRLFDGGPTAWVTACSAAAGAVTWYVMTLRAERF